MTQKKYKGSPREFSDLSDETQVICRMLAEKLVSTLHNKLHGLYLYGAMTFPESDHVIDIDFHVILKEALTLQEKEAIEGIHRDLAEEFTFLTLNDLDGWYILLDDVQESTPMHQIKTMLFDRSWALHRAHMRAGYCIVMHGPAPQKAFPEPTWPELADSLDSEQEFIVDREHMRKYPGYCILNACRLMYSHKKRDAVVSKRASADWAIENFPYWKDLINAAVRSYAKDEKNDDFQLLELKTASFLQFAFSEITFFKETEVFESDQDFI